MHKLYFVKAGGASELRLRRIAQEASASGDRRAAQVGCGS